MSEGPSLSRRHLLGMKPGQNSTQPDDETISGPVVAAIDGTHCLAVNLVSCRACEDHCGERAIKFKPTLGQCEQPKINVELCTGCGDCISVCPVDALALIGCKGENDNAHHA